MFTPYYNESIRKIVVAFGSMFNDIQLRQTNSSGDLELIRVPLAYGPKEKFIRRIEEQSSISNSTKVQITLPILGFNITDITYDSTRKRNTMQKRRTHVAGSSAEHMSFNFTEVPYNFNISLYAFTRTMNDSLQIMEQILPYFTPEFNVTVNFNDVNKKVDVPIVLQSVSLEEDYEGDFDTRRNLTSEFSFTVKANVYGPVKKSSVIAFTETTFFNLFEENYLTANPSGALSRVDVGISGSSSDTSLSISGASIGDYTLYSNIYSAGPSGSTAGGLYSYTNIDTLGNTYADAYKYPPAPNE